MPSRVHKIEDDVLFDCDLSSQRIVLGVARSRRDRPASLMRVGPLRAFRLVQPLIDFRPGSAFISRAAAAHPSSNSICIA